VYDGGTYAGDALVEFLSGGEKRFISYGEDLSVTAYAEASSERIMSAVSVSGGIMTIRRKQIYDRTYTIKNNSAASREIVIEHPITAGAELSGEEGGAGIALDAGQVLEKTQTAYRFLRSVEAGRETVFSVREELPLSESVTLAGLRIEAFLSYASNGEISPAVRSALGEAASLKQKTDAARQNEAAMAVRRDRLIAEQGRIRSNLEAAGSGTPQGQEYLKRLAAADDDIDDLSRLLEEAEKASRAAEEAFQAYLASLSF
jgi:hypothetical protein